MFETMRYVHTPVERTTRINRITIDFALSLPSFHTHTFFTDPPPPPPTRSSLLPASVWLYIYLPTLTSLLIFIPLITPQFTQGPPLLSFVTLFHPHSLFPLIINTDA